jgi:hypothetical protein
LSHREGEAGKSRELVRDGMTLGVTFLGALRRSAMAGFQFQAIH